MKCRVAKRTEMEEIVGGVEMHAVVVTEPISSCDCNDHNFEEWS